MPGPPSCLRRRYEAIDDLVRDLNSVPQEGSVLSCCRLTDTSVKLLCDFWNILKEDPNCDLTRAVQQRLGSSLSPMPSATYPQRFTCYMAGTHPKDCCDKHRGKGKAESSEKVNFKSSCCSTRPEVKKKPSSCCTSGSIHRATPDVLPLSKVLINLKEASSYHKKCNERISELMATEKKLQEQIDHLESREKEGVQLLRQADCMWTCMEEAYKKKIAESIEKQKSYIAQLKEIDKSNSKWRKNKRDLELELDTIEKVAKETEEKINHKTNDLRVLRIEISDLQKRIDTSTKDIECAKKCFGPKKLASDAKVKSLNEEIKKLEASIKEERKLRDIKEREGAKFVKETRNDLTKICKCVLQKRMINDDLKAEQCALEQEIKMLNDAHGNCRVKCNLKVSNVIEELDKVQKEIDNFKLKCIQCHKCIDTSDARQYCIDCPKCSEERDCLVEGDTCNLNPGNTCVCMSTKQKLIDNVFENMYSVLAKQAKTKAGKVVANSVVECLKRSQNGKLDYETRRLLQGFIMKSIKKNLNITIVGGAVKTRCEMDPETYNHLMSCLKQVKVVTVAKVDEGTVAKKDPCRRWPNSGECHCPKGPNNCICSRKGPPPIKESSSRPTSEKSSRNDETKICPHKDESECGPDCGMQGVGSELAKYRPDACKPKTCKFPGSNMRAAQCTLGPEALGVSKASKRVKTSCSSHLPKMPKVQSSCTTESCATCTCGNVPCCCQPDNAGSPRARIIEEVMGNYFEVISINEESCDCDSDVSVIFIPKEDK